MKKPLSFINTRGMAPAVLGAIASVLFVALVTYAATTINNNVNTGGTLTVSGDSTLTGTTTSAGGIYASSTVFTDGIFTNTRNAILGAASGTPAVTGLNVTGNSYLTGALGVGTATTSAGGLQVSGMGVFNSAIDVRSGTSTFAGAAFGLMGSSTPYLEVGIAGDVAIGGALGTSTLSVETTTASRGGCIELRSEAGTWIRLYAGAGGATTTDNRVHVGPAGVGLIIGQGRCQTGNE